MKGSGRREPPPLVRRTAHGRARLPPILRAGITRSINLPVELMGCVGLPCWVERLLRRWVLNRWSRRTLRLPLINCSRFAVNLSNRNGSRRWITCRLLPHVRNIGVRRRTVLIRVRRVCGASCPYRRSRGIESVLLNLLGLGTGRSREIPPLCTRSCPIVHESCKLHELLGNLGSKVR